MSDAFKTVGVLGNGGWGTALAIVSLRNGAETRQWGIEDEYVAECAKKRTNPRYLAGVELPDELLLTSNSEEAFQGIDLLVSVVPTQYLAATLDLVLEHVPAGVPVLSCSKGIERRTQRRPTEVLATALPRHPLGVLSGPNHAEEVAIGRPATAVVASKDADMAQSAQRLFSDPRFRLYATDDVLGVELAAAVKNVIALAAGMVDGLELGDNAKAALITRGAAEMSRLGVALGARQETFSGLAGIGDLIATCVSPHGRNRGVGERLGRGESLDDILASMVQVVEGIATTRGVIELAHAHDVELPICQAVQRILYDGLSPAGALDELMTRELRDERE